MGFGPRPSAGEWHWPLVGRRFGDIDLDVAGVDSDSDDWAEAPHVAG